MSVNEKRIIELAQHDLTIKRLGEPLFDSPFKNAVNSDAHLVPEEERVVAFVEKSIIDDFYKKNKIVPSFEMAGPRKKIFFEPGETVSAIVTCGGICPGLNAVIQGIVKMNYYRYNNQRIYGISNGYAGLVKENAYGVKLLTPRMVENIQMDGGTILGTSRGPQDPEKMVDMLEEMNINILYAIGGDGTQRGAMTIIEEIERRNLHIGVIGVPKTIDNDINYIDRSFGTETAFSEACKAIDSAYTEACSVNNGIGIVKLMGRDSGFIAANATLAANQVDFCLIPELDFSLEGENGLLKLIEKKLRKKHHCVIVVAEGAGQKYVTNPNEQKTDASGNKKLGNIGEFLAKQIKLYLSEKNIIHSVKYIDPSYIIRSCSPTPNDSIFCSQLAQMAVHAGMSGRTGMVVGYMNGFFTHIPMEIATSKRKKINLNSQLWLSVLEETGQPSTMQ